MVGVGLGLLREMMDGRFRTREQVRSVVEADCLALIPKLGDAKTPYRGHALGGLLRSVGMAMPGMGARTAPDMSGTEDDGPSSPYADAIRAIKLDLDHRAHIEKNRSYENETQFVNATGVVGLTSCLSGEGKSSVAAGMATLIAQGGGRVVLVDGDVRNRSLTRRLAPKASIGLLDVIAKRVPVEDAVWRGLSSNLAFLPTVKNPNLGNPADLLASDDAKAFFSSLRLEYDYVIVDLAPLISTVDVRATSRLIDSYILVIEWGATKIDEVRYALRHAPDVQHNIVGAVLNKVNMAALRHYDAYGAKHYYDGYGAD